MSRWYATALFVTLATMWGLSFPAISVGLDYIPPLLFAAFRYDTAAVLLLGYAAVSTDGWRPVGRNDRHAIVFGGLFLVAGNGLLSSAHSAVAIGTIAWRMAATPLGTVCWPMKSSPFPATRNRPPKTIACLSFRPTGRQPSVETAA